MKIMKNKIIGLFFAMSAAGTLQAQNVQQVIVGDNMNYGITYSLPQTAIQLKVKATMTKTEAGMFAPYAEKYLGLTDVAMTDQTKWELNSITLDGAAVPDTSRTYHILFSEKGQMPVFYLSEEGNLLSINREPEIIVSDAEEEKPAKKAKLVLKATDVLSEEILKAGSKAKQAELTAREIFSIRESKRNLLKGDVDNMPADGASFQIMIDNLNAQEEALLSLFEGVSQVEDVERVIEYVPTENVDNEVLFRFSGYEGFVDKDDLIGEPYYVSVNIIEDNRMEPVAVEGKKKAANNGIAFNIPGKASVKISYDGEVIAQTTMQMGQLGHVEQLPSSQFSDKKKMASAAFNPLTGSIRIYEQ